MCTCASGAHAHLDSAAYPRLVLLGDPVIAIMALSQRIALLHILAFCFCMMILSGISVNTKMSKDDRCLLTVDVARTAATLCSRLASGSEQRFSLILASKAGFGWRTSSEHRLMSPWPCVPSEKEAGLKPRGRNAIAVQSPAPEGWEVSSSRQHCSAPRATRAHVRNCPSVFFCSWVCRTEWSSARPPLRNNHLQCERCAGPCSALAPSLYFCTILLN